jgi:SAM-dependent methyltransferase
LAGGRRKLLEIGSAYGFFLEVARRRFAARGIDITREGCEYAKQRLGLEVLCADFMSVDFPSEYAEIVCMWDTIEHLARPDLYVEKIARIISPKGLLCITTGDIESIMARLRKGKWRLIHPPTHLYYFSRRSLGKLLGKFGFKIIYAEHCGFYRSLEQMTYGLFYLNKGKGSKAIYKGLSKLPVMNRSVYVNLGDILYVIAERD